MSRKRQCEEQEKQAGKSGRKSRKIRQGKAGKSAGKGTEKMLEIKGLKKTYYGRIGGVEALNGVDLEIGPGEIVGLFGENGAGKTTLLKSILGLENTRTGDLTDRGQNRGIFYFPYEWEADRDLIRLDLTQVRKAGEFPWDVYPIQMLLDEDESLMYLAVKEKEGYGLYIYALEGETPMLLQQIPVNRNNLSGNMEYLARAADSRPEEEADGSVLLPYFCRMSLEEGGVLMTWSDNSFSFVARENGQYRWWCDGMFPDSREYEEAPFPIENVCAFDGKRLVLAAYENWYSLNVLTAVYDEQGQKYVGLYRHSEENDIDEGLGIYSKVMPQGTREKPFMYSTYGGSIRDKIVKPLEIMIEKQ